MTDLSPLTADIIEDPSQYDSVFFPGAENRFIRYYFYLNNGLAILNNFRNLFFGVFALYFTFHLTNPYLLAALLVPGILILIAVGYYSIHRMSKVQEWLGMRFATHYGIRSYNYNQGTYEELKEIKELLKDAKLKS